MVDPNRVQWFLWPPDAPDAPGAWEAINHTRIGNMSYRMLNYQKLSGLDSREFMHVVPCHKAWSCFAAAPSPEIGIFSPETD